MHETDTLTGSLRVFFCYSHIDEELRDEIERHLSILKHKKVLDSWHDRRIGAGTDWEGQIDHHLNSADIVVLLVSAAFMSSGYCYDVEMKKALERHASGEAKVLPVILRPVDWQGAPFEHLQILPRDAKPIVQWKDRDEALLDVARGIREACSELSRIRAEQGKKTQVVESEGLPAVAERTSKLEGEIRLLSEKFETLADSVRALENYCSSLRNRHDHLDERYTALESSLNDSMNFPEQAKAINSPDASSGKPQSASETHSPRFPKRLQGNRAKVFLVTDKEGNEHRVQGDLSVRIGRSHMASCEVSKGALKTPFPFSSMSHISMERVGDEIAVRFTLLNENGERGGAISIRPYDTPYDPFLNVTVEGARASMSLDRIQWPVLCVETD